MIALLVSILQLAPAGAIAVKLPDVGQLARAVRSGDDVEIERVAARLGAVRLTHIAERGKREERLAALRALSVVSDGWALLPELARLAADTDASIAEAAAITARRIAEGMSPQTVESEEVPRDVPQRAAAVLLEQANKTALQSSVRVSAIWALAALRGIVKIDEAGLSKLLSDGEPQVRRAVAEALVNVPSADKALETALAADASVSVASAAAASLCRDVPATAVPKSVAMQRAAKLGPPARARLRALAVDESVSLADRLDLLACVRVNLQPDDQKILDQLAKHPQESLKRRARSLGGR